MKNTQDLLDAAELALAGYGQFLNIGAPPIADLKVLNKDPAGFAEFQARKFADRLELLIPTYNDATRPLSDEDRRLGINQTSFDVSVFQRQTGAIKDQIYLAIRGTQQKFEVPNDLSANAEILLGHGAASQIVAMANWWRRVSAPEGSEVLQFRIETRSDPSSPPAGAVLLSRVSEHPSMWDYLVQTAKVLSTGELAAALRSSGGVTVTGSSMGGHLAMAFAALFGDQVKQAVAFNAPGFADNEYLRNLFTGLGGTLPRVGDAKILNVVSSEEADPADDLNVVAGFPDGNFPGRKLLLPIEDQTFSDVPDPKTPSGNHDRRDARPSKEVQFLGPCCAQRGRHRRGRQTHALAPDVHHCRDLGLIALRSNAVRGRPSARWSRVAGAFTGTVRHHRGAVGRAAWVKPSSGRTR